MDRFLQAAFDEAQKGKGEGGVPIGSVLVIDDKIVGRGHNQRVQKDSVILHAEMAALEDAGRLKPCDYQRSTLYTTLSPCEMCSGTISLYKIPRVVIGENITFGGNEKFLSDKGVEVKILNNQECVVKMETFIDEHPDLWFEDIGKKMDTEGDC